MTSKKIIISIFLLLGGAAVFVFGNPYYSVFPTNGDQDYLLGLTLFLLILAVVMKRVPKLSIYSPAAYALFIASAGTLFLGTGILNLHVSRVNPAKFLAADKFSQFLHVVPVILGLTLIAGDNLGSIFIKSGNLKRGLIFGAISFIGFGFLVILTQWTSLDVFRTRPSTIPWLLVFIFANATMEELWFRGIFLKKYEPLVGRLGAIILTSIIFGASHINATYAFPGGGIVFGLVVFGIGWVGAHAMFKDDSIIGPILFHAGYDLMVIVSVLQTV
jgi:membrane protease YdiL (CAAX protease family)